MYGTRVRDTLCSLFRKEVLLLKRVLEVITLHIKIVIQNTAKNLHVRVGIKPDFEMAPLDSGVHPPELRDTQPPVLQAHKVSCRHPSWDHLLL